MTVYGINEVLLDLVAEKRSFALIVIIELN